jgi:hypothetical protein
MPPERIKNKILKIMNEKMSKRRIQIRVWRRFQKCSGCPGL